MINKEEAQKDSLNINLHLSWTLGTKNHHNGSPSKENIAGVHRKENEVEKESITYSSDQNP